MKYPSLFLKLSYLCRVLLLRPGVLCFSFPLYRCILPLWHLRYFINFVRSCTRKENTSVPAPREVISVPWSREACFPLGNNNASLTYRQINCLIVVASSCRLSSGAEQSSLNVLSPKFQILISI